MSSERIIGTVFIGLGALVLFSWLAGAWLWVGALAAAFLYVYARNAQARRRGYAFLIVGSLLTGLAVGLLLGSSGALLVSLGAGFFAIDRLEPRASRWPIYPAAALAILGALACLGSMGLFGSFWFAFLLIALGAFLLLRGESSGGWVYHGPAQAAGAPEDVPPSGTRADTATARPAEASSRAPHAPPAPAVSPAADSAGTPAAPAPEAAPRGTSLESEPESEVIKNALQGQTDLQAEAAERETPLSPEDAALYRRLETWRKGKAASENKPAYLVLTNDSLRRVALEKPTTPEGLRAVKGIGPVKLERYGDEILELVRSAAEERREG